MKTTDMCRGFVVLIFIMVSCQPKNEQLATPKQFLNRVIVQDTVYFKDSVSILANLYSKMKNHEASFTNEEYFDSTELTIDTIMYDSTLNKIAAFVIAKNPSYRNPYRQTDTPYYYNASCYLGKRLSPDSSTFELKNTGPYFFNNFDTREEISKAIRYDYFMRLTQKLDENGQPSFEYNLNDKRFWNSMTGWKRAFP